MANKRYRYIEVMRSSAEGLDEALSQALADVEERGGEVAHVSLAIIPMPKAAGPDSKDLIRVAQVMVTEPSDDDRSGAW